jgi:antibiotic biosynthesis monooxygenase (ABM) superfamily enzyme
MTSFQPNQAPQASLIVEHIVLKGKGWQFRWWHASLTQSARQAKGYIRTALCPPVKGAQLRWYSIIHFDSSEHLNLWLKSDEREKLLESGQKVFKTYQFKSFATCLEGWLSHEAGLEKIGLGPSAWKQNLAVVLGLYPVVMIQSMLFTEFGIMKYWSLASSMLVNNLVTSSILTWVAMPFVTRWLSFWLQPAYQAVPVKINILGAAIVSTLLVLVAAIFNFA